MANESEIIKAIQNVIHDESLNVIPDLWLCDDLIDTAKKWGFSLESIELMKLIESNHPRLANASYCTANTSRTVTPISLAKWLANRAKIVGAESAYSSILSLELNTEITSYNVTLLRGLQFQGAIDLGLGIYLADFHHLPSQIQQNVNDKVMKLGRSIDLPCTFLYRVFDLNLTNFVDTESRFNSDDYSILESLITNFFSIFSRRYAPIVDRRWSVLPDDVPLSGIVDNTCQSFLGSESPFWRELFTKDVAENLKMLLCKYMAIPEDLRLPIEISIFRLSTSMNSFRLVDKAIDLGIALEALLVDENSTTKKAAQVRSVGSRLVPKVRDFKVRSVIHTVYGIRSDAVHRGKIKDAYSLDSKGVIPTSELLMLGVEVLQLCLIEIIKSGGVVPRVEQVSASS